MKLLIGGEKPDDDEVLRAIASSASFRQELRVPVRPERLRGNNWIVLEEGFANRYLATSRQRAGAAIIIRKTIVVIAPSEMREQLDHLADKALIDKCAAYRPGKISEAISSTCAFLDRYLCCSFTHFG